MHALFAPEHARQVLAGSHGHSKQLPLYREIAAALGDGLLTSDRDDWQRQRRIVQPLFTRQQIAGYATVMAQEATRLLQGWELAAASGRPVDLHRQLTGYTMQVLGRLLLGSDLGDAIEEVTAAFPIINRHIRRRALAPLRVPRGWPTPANRRATWARRRLDRVVDQLIGQRRAAGGPGGQDLLGRLLAARDPDTGAGLDDAELRAQVLLFLLAGHETTATALTFTLWLLGHHPQAQQRVRDEVRQMVGDRTPTAEDAASAADTTMVVKEAMRLYPPAYGIARRTGHDLAIGGYHLPEGSVVISTWMLHHLPDHWDRPGVFDPDRFTPQREAARHRYAYLPFGAGPRACIGGSFALLEAVLATAMTVRAYRLETTPEPVPLTAGITLRPATAVPCVLQPVPHDPR
jgi:cytochrome P450